MNPFEEFKKLSEMKVKSQQLQQDIENLTATGSAGGRMVNITLNGKMQMTDIQIDPICVDSRDVQMLQDLIIAAHNSAASNLNDLIGAKTKQMIGDFNLSKLGL